MARMTRTGRETKVGSHSDSEREDSQRPPMQERSHLALTTRLCCASGLSNPAWPPAWLLRGWGCEKARTGRESAVDSRCVKDDQGCLGACNSLWKRWWRGDAGCGVLAAVHGSTGDPSAGLGVDMWVRAEMCVSRGRRPCATRASRNLVVAGSALSETVSAKLISQGPERASHTRQERWVVHTNTATAASTYQERRNTMGGGELVNLWSCLQRCC